MAVDSLKRTGTSIDLYTYNSGPESASLNSILGKSEMKDMDIIFGLCTNSTSSRWPNLPRNKTHVW